MTLIGQTTFAKTYYADDYKLLVHIKLYSIWNLQHRTGCIFNGERVALTVYQGSLLVDRKETAVGA